ncbi:MAG: hypothetical protein KF687_02590 [Cyclobacteriaceae bacterium]|nr:hypothetical protein [Cyclobacteriaceae bacterium]
MKTIIIVLTVVIGIKAFSQSDVKTHYAAKDNFVISALGGGAERTNGVNKTIYPLINFSAGYGISNRFIIFSDALFYYNKSMQSDVSEDSFSKAAHYGIGLRYTGAKNLKCGTPTVQSGVYVFSNDKTETSLDWLVTPGWICPISTSEKTFLNLGFDFQMNKLITGERALVSAKIGLLFYL